MIVTVDRDLSDLGVSSWDGLEHRERLAEIVNLRLKAEQLQPGRKRRTTGTATAKQREAAKNLARRSCHWETPSKSRYLLVACHHCGAPELQWCRRITGGRSVTGKLCPQRGT
jgi:hypothetical protein